MERDEVRKLIHEAIEKLMADGDVPQIDLSFDVAPPRKPEHGDLATNAAMVIASKAKADGIENINPRDIATKIAQAVGESPMIAGVEIAGPGFINFRLAKTWVQDVVNRVLEQNETYGHSNAGQGQRVQVEFVSANPVGPIHIGNARGGPFGDALASLLAASGCVTAREYYVNDGPDNTQLKIFGSSVQARYRTLAGQETPLPENGYMGEYVTDLGRGIFEQDGAKHLDIAIDEAGGLYFARLVEDTMLSWLRADCAAVGIEFDVWFSEQTLHDAGAVEAAVNDLIARGVAYENEGAIWLKTKDFGDDDDRVLCRSNGAYTYIASDLAYAANKFDRGFEHLIYIWGPDHAGYVPRLKAAISALGKGTCEIILYQHVRFLEDGQPLGLSKRKGAIVSIRDLVNEIGLDATRFFFLMRSVDAHLDFDLDLAKKQSQENPVYYVQYAHARICSIVREGETRGILAQDHAAVDLSLLTHEDEFTLMRKISEYPYEIAEAAAQRAPHRMTYYARELAQCFHQFYGTCRVLDPEAPELSQARLKLTEATRIVLRNVLTLLGLQAPERM